MDFASVIKKGQPSVEPHELTLITDQRDPLYDARIELPILDGAILNFAAVGQAQPVSVRPRGVDELVVVDGVQRVKRALVVNHLTGRKAYAGKLAPVLEAIKRLTGSDLGKRIIEEAPGGMKLQVTLYRGGDKEALRAKASANTWRVDDARAEWIRKAQQMARHGIEHEAIAADLGVTPATVERMLAVNPDKPRARKERSKTRKPGASKLRAAWENMDADDSGKLVLGWALGEVKLAELLKDYPRLSAVLKAKRKAA